MEENQGATSTPEWAVVKQNSIFMVCRNTKTGKFLFITGDEKKESDTDNLNCTDCVDCHFCINCSKCSNCDSCISCNDCIKCNDCYNISNSNQKSNEAGTDGTNVEYSNEACAWYKKDDLYIAYVFKKFVGASFIPLLNCIRCTNSRYLIECNDCSECVGCVYCSKSVLCADSISLVKCTRCKKCATCSECNGCINCSMCSNSITCIECAACKQSFNCIKCSNCSGCNKCAELKDMNNICDKALIPFDQYQKQAAQSQHT